MATKERRKAPPRAPKYHRLTEEKRIIIETLRKEGCSKNHIAEALAKPSRTQAVRLASGRFFAGFSMMRRGAAEQPGETGLFPCF